MVEFKTNGVCANKIKFNIINERIWDVEFVNGCEGNLTGIGKLVEGMEVAEVVRRLEGISCGGKATSCPDQLATALKQELVKQKAQK